MSGRYEVEDLLKLRASPLITKPPNLPPIEEWMGTVDLNPRRPGVRGKTEENSNTTDTFPKRPNFLDNQTRRSTTDPERIHLGPPRRSFASSNTRKFGGNDGDDTPSKERSGNHERTKTSESADYKFGDRKGATYASSNGRLSGRLDEDDSESRPRRDAPKWGPRENKDTDERRGKFDQPWIRKGKGGDSIDEGRKDGPAWRRAAADRETLQTEKNEVAPEWADSIDDAEPAKAHTHEDFLLWMESMKSKTTGENKTGQGSNSTPQSHLAETKPSTTVSSASLIAPDMSVDKFFAKFEEKKNPTEATAGGKPTKSRFASIFNTKVEAKMDSFPQEQADLPSPTRAAFTTPPVSSNSIPDPEKKANDEAFAKLLEMLNKNQANSSQQGPALLKAFAPQNAHEPDYSRQSQSPDLVSLFGRNSNAQQPAPSHTPTQSLDHLLESRSPVEQAQKPASKATTEDLLSLLRRSNLNETQQQQHPHQHHEQRPPPGLFPTGLDLRDRQPPPFDSGPRETAHSPFDEFSFGGMRYRDDMEAQQQPQRHQGNNVANMFAEMNNEGFRPHIHQPGRPVPPQGSSGPPGLQRPPGLENMPRMPPGWPNQPPPLPQHSQPRQGPPPQAPPGINQPPRGMPQYAGPPQPPNYMNPQQQQRLPPRKQTSESNAPPGFANGMPPPPPGFGPPHAFASPPGPMPNMGRYAMGGGMGLADRERIERQGMFADMYNGSGRGSGGIGVPPGFR